MIKFILFFYYKIFNPKLTYKNMILVKCDKDGVVTELSPNGTFLELHRMVNTLIKEYESNGIMLIKDKMWGKRGRITEFATEENGWECSLGIADGWAGNISLRDDDEK